MLTHPTQDQLQQLGLLGMARAFGDIQTDPDSASLSHADWLALLLDYEVSHRHDRRLAARLRYANSVIRRLSRMSTTALCAVSTASCFRSWQAAPGSMPMTI